MQNKEYQWIDKTECLQEGIDRFPSIYIEGNAATGKSVAVKMLLKKCSKMDVKILDIRKESGELPKILQKLQELQMWMQTRECWVVLENMPEDIPRQLSDQLIELVEKIENDSKVIFVSRYKPQDEFLKLLWNDTMELISMNRLMLSKEEVRVLAKRMQSTGDADEIYEKTGGWAGCVNMLLRLAKSRSETVEELLNSYEMKTYIQQEIFSALTAREEKLLEHAAGCPWINEELCREVWGVSDAQSLLTDLERKGFLVLEKRNGRYQGANLFSDYIHMRNPEQGHEDIWYESRGCIEEALFCLKKSGAEKEYENAIVKYYDKISSFGLLTEEMLRWTQKRAQYCYLRGVYAWRNRDFEVLKKEISYVEKIPQKGHLEKEILLNLSYLNPEITLIQWMELLSEYSGDGSRYRLYELQGNTMTCLCGIRDLTDLFTCSKKEELKKCNLWKQSLGEAEWKCYQLARIDYYLETRRKDQIFEEDWKLLREKEDYGEPWMISVAKLYLLCRLRNIQQEEVETSRIKQLLVLLREERNSECKSLTEAISSIYAQKEERDHVATWLHYLRMDDFSNVEENNYIIFFWRAKAYVLLGQYERAERILKRLIPYLQTYHRYRLTSEMIFVQSIVNWKKNLKGQAIRNVIESFFASGNGRYVAFYTEYGLGGQQVLEAYMEWQKTNSSGNWNRKKRYHYVSVFRMPFEDYIQLVVRNVKKASKEHGWISEDYIEERLTLMETIVLQNIGRGLTNAQICEELDLKLPTVKGHVYSIFKKLGVSSRVQAIVRGKELGVLKQ